MDLFELSQSLFELFISFFNDLRIPFTTPLGDLFGDSGLGSLFSQILGLFGIDVESVSLLSFIFGIGLITILVVTFAKWVIGLVP